MKKVLVVKLALLFVLVVSVVVFADGKWIFAKALDDHECNSEEWHFVITEVQEGMCPDNIEVTWENGQTERVGLGKQSGGVCHYTTIANLDSRVEEAKTMIYGSWSGQFVLSHGPCPPEEPTPTPEEPTPTPEEPTPTPEEPTPTPEEPTPTPEEPTPTPEEPTPTPEEPTPTPEEPTPTPEEPTPTPEEPTPTPEEPTPTPEEPTPTPEEPTPTPTPTPEPFLPVTGSESNPLAVAAALALGGLAFAAAIWLRWKRR